MSVTSRKVLFLILVLSSVVCLVAENRTPLIIAHRGSSGTHPEESEAAYIRAAERGADFLECDIQATKDNMLVCSHEPNLSFLITDIEDEKHRAKFPTNGNRLEIVDRVSGAGLTVKAGWFINDYNLEDIKLSV